MEERLKSDSSTNPKPDELSEGWNGARENGKRARASKESPPHEPRAELEELEKRLNAGWDKPEA